MYLWWHRRVHSLINKFANFERIMLTNRLCVSLKFESVHSQTQAMSSPQSVCSTPDVVDGNETTSMALNPTGNLYDSYTFNWQHMVIK